MKFSLLRRLILIILSTIIPTSPVFAIPDSNTLDFFAINGIYNYDPTGEEIPPEAKNPEACSAPASIHSTTPSGDSITWIGDSYTAIAEEDYKLISTNLPNTDLGNGAYYQVSKHIVMNGGSGNLGGTSGLNILKDIKSKGNLGNYLVFALGTNDADFGKDEGAFSTALNTIIDSEHAGTDTTVILVSPKTNDSTEKTAFANMTKTMKSFANSHENVLLADWNAAAKGKESKYFSTNDSTHPNEAGFKVWFDTIKNTLPGEVNNNVSSLTSSTSSSTLPAETIAYLDSENVKASVEANMARYKYAEEQTGLPWQIVATLHYREASLSSNKSISNGEELYEHTNVDGVHVSADPNQDAKEAAEHFIEMAKSVYNIDTIANPSTENYALGFLAYNRGYMYKNGGASWQDSPYVMNGYDAEHMNMRFIHADSWNGSQKLNNLEGKVNTSPGALAFLTYLGGIKIDTSGTTTTTASLTPVNEKCYTPLADTNATNSGSGSSIAKIAVSMSWPYQDGENKGKCTNLSGQVISYTHRDGNGGCAMNPRDNYEEAVKKYDIPHASLSSYASCKDKTYCDCGMFVQTVLAATFPDENFANHNPNEHDEFVAYLLSQPDKWEEIENLGNTSNLQPGDIFLNPGHRMIYVGEYGGEHGDLASASAGQNVGEISAMYFNHSSGPFRIFRRKGTEGAGNYDAIGVNGLSEEMAAKLLARYAENKNDDSRKAVGANYWDKNCKPNQCTAFSAFFVTKFTKQSLTGGTFNGGDAVKTAISESGGSAQSTPEVFSLFEAPGHTGIVVGKKEDGTIIYANYNGHNCSAPVPDSSAITNFNPTEYYSWNYQNWGSMPHAGVVSYNTGVGGTASYLKLDVDTEKLLNYINNGP